MKKILWLSLFIAGSLSAKECLTFEKGRHINELDKYFSKNKEIEESVRGDKIYSASYDLNGDGSNEYFYYIESFIGCGQVDGCFIDVYRLVDGRFLSLKEYGFSTFYKFNPEQPEHKNYICILDESDNGWRRFVYAEQSIQVFNGKSYQAKRE